MYFLSGAGTFILRFSKNAISREAVLKVIIKTVGGADGTLDRGMQRQGMSLWMTLRHGTTPWITSSYIPTLPGRVFFLKDLAGPLVAECN